MTDPENLDGIVRDIAEQEGITDGEVITETTDVIRHMHAEFADMGELTRGAVVIMKVVAKYSGKGRPGARIAASIIRMIILGAAQSFIGASLGIEDGDVVEMLEFMRDWFLDRF